MTGLKAQDVVLTIIHIMIVGFNLFGWIWKATRKAHLVLVLLTAASWFILGMWNGVVTAP